MGHGTSQAGLQKCSFLGFLLGYPFPQKTELKDKFYPLSRGHKKMTNTTYLNCTNPYQADTGSEARIVHAIPLGEYFFYSQHLLSEVDNWLPPERCDQVVQGTM